MKVEMQHGSPLVWCSCMPTTRIKETPVGHHSATSGYTFPTPTPLPLQAAFDGGRLTSDGGLPWLAEADTALGLCALIAAFVPEWRKRTGQHALAPQNLHEPFRLSRCW